MRFLPSVGIIFCLLSLATCTSSSGVKIDQSKLETLQKGKTTYSEMLQELGKPTSSTTFSDGSQTAFYSYTSVRLHSENFIPIVGAFIGKTDSSATVASLTFDRNGVLKDYTVSRSSHGADPDDASREDKNAKGSE